MPDVYYNLDGFNRSGWLEVKYLKLTNEFHTFKSGLTAEQANFLVSETQFGGFAHLLLGVNDNWFLVKPKSFVVSDFEVAWHIADYRRASVDWGHIIDGPKRLVQVLKEIHNGEIR